MPYGKTCDTLWRHPKWRAASKGARALWTSAQSYGMDQLTDGVILTSSLSMLDGTEDEAADLVRVGLWELAADADGQLVGWRFHDWYDHNPKRIEVLADRRIRTAARAQPALRRRVRVRDGSTCRYCGRHVVWSDRRSGIGGTYDIVTPADDVTPDNVVVCCRDCSTKKAGRSQDDAGMYLGPAQAPAPESRGGSVRPFPPRSQDVPRSDPDMSQVGPGSDLDRFQVVPESYLGTHQPPYPFPSPLRGGDGNGGETPPPESTWTTSAPPSPPSSCGSHRASPAGGHARTSGTTPPAAPAAAAATTTPPAAATAAGPPSPAPAPATNATAYPSPPASWPAAATAEPTPPNSPPSPPPAEPNASTPDPVQAALDETRRTLADVVRRRYGKSHLVGINGAKRYLHPDPAGHHQAGLPLFVELVPGLPPVATGEHNDPQPLGELTAAATA